MNSHNINKNDNFILVCFSIMANLFDNLIFAEISLKLSTTLPRSHPHVSFISLLLFFENRRWSTRVRHNNSYAELGSRIAIFPIDSHTHCHSPKIGPTKKEESGLPPGEPRNEQRVLKKSVGVLITTHNRPTIRFFPPFADHLPVSIHMRANDCFCDLFVKTIHVLTPLKICGFLCE